MRKLLASACLSLFAVSAAFSAPGGVTIISATGTGGFGDAGGVYYVSWTQTGAYSGVSIAASLYTTGAPASGNAYLTTKVGSGATAAQQVAAAPFTVSNTSPSLVTVLTGVTLSPGTYYLVLDLSAAGLVWQSNATATITAASGVTANSDSSGSLAASYPPASPGLAPSGLIDRTYSVTGTFLPPTVPALSPLGMLVTTLSLIGSGLWILRRYGHSLA